MNLQVVEFARDKNLAVNQLSRNLQVLEFEGKV